MSESRSYPPHQLGVGGEQLAAQRVSLLGWKIMRKNYQLGRREIDLIMARRAILAFVEVTRAQEIAPAPQRPPSRHGSGARVEAPSPATFSCD